METIRTRELWQDKKKCATKAVSDVHFDVPEYKISQYRNEVDELRIKLDFVQGHKSNLCGFDK